MVCFNYVSFHRLRAQHHRTISHHFVPTPLIPYIVNYLRHRCHFRHRFHIHAFLSLYQLIQHVWLMTLGLPLNNKTSNHFYHCHRTGDHLALIVLQLCLHPHHASGHNGVHFFDIQASSKRDKGVRTRQFLTRLTSKCASRHSTVHFSTSQLLKVVRTWCALCMLTSTCASCHTGVHFLDMST